MGVEKCIIYTAGRTPACVYAGTYLKSLGFTVVDTPCDGVRYLLLDVPAFGTNGRLRSGENTENLLTQLPPDITVCGGNLNQPALTPYETVDFLADEIYLCENARITAECALDVAFPYLTRAIHGCPVLILGWGRIGKCLGKLLQAMGADVTIAARNPAQRAMIHALGYETAAFDALDLTHSRLIFNTIPHPVLNYERMSQCREDCIKIELASKDGMEGDDIIIARGLPGLHMPESSGKLIGDTFIRLCFWR